MYPAAAKSLTLNFVFVNKIYDKKEYFTFSTICPIINGTMAAFGYDIAPAKASEDMPALQKRLPELENEIRQPRLGAEQRFNALAEPPPAISRLDGRHAL